ncbi:putative T6SS immunity periplasmic lipoprotein [Winslowiella iniecta]|nr:putative T6SS immunity periplasmic lipoprotein [Winslowiella iniecta]
MKIVILLACCFLLAGCPVHPLPHRAALVSLGQNGQPCFKVKKESVTGNNQSRIMAIVVRKIAEDDTLSEVWRSDDLDFPIKIVVPGQCIPVDYKFQPYQKYSVTIYTIVPPNQVETKRFWRARFELQNLKA